MKNGTDSQPEGSALISPAESREEDAPAEPQLFPRWSRAAADDDSTWERHQDDGTFPAWL